MYEIINSIVFEKSGNVIGGVYRNIVEIIQNTDDDEYKKEQIETNYRLNKITQNEANELF